MIRIAGPGGPTVAINVVETVTDIATPAGAPPLSGTTQGRA